MEIELNKQYSISKLKATDAKQLHDFILENNDRFKMFFPLTLSSNATVEKSIEYIEVKNKEIKDKTNFTFAI